MELSFSSDVPYSQLTYVSLPLFLLQNLSWLLGIAATLQAVGASYIAKPDGSVGFNVTFVTMWGVKSPVFNVSID